MQAAESKEDIARMARMLIGYMRALEEGARTQDGKETMKDLIYFVTTNVLDEKEE